MNFIKYSLATTSLLLAFASQAATITQLGDNVSFTYEDSTAYGTGNVIGDTIFFTPLSFSAQSSNGAGVDFTTATLNIDVLATTQGYNMSSFTLYEDGDYRVDGSGASAAADGFFRATSLTTLCSGPCQDTVLFDAGTLASTGVNNALWDMGGSLDLSWGSDTKVRLTIQNNLTAETTESGENAFIQKKFSVTIPQVPVPAAVWLFGSGLLGLVGVARRKA